MPGKRKSAKSAKSSSSRASSGKKKGKKSARSSAKSNVTSSRPSTATEREPDIMDEPAMANLYYIAHGPVDALELRGFNWPSAPSGGKKKGKKGKKKK